MAGFVSGDLVPEETYDFTAHGGQAGVIPEPSYEMINQFRKVFLVIIDGVKDTLGDIEGVDDPAKMSVNEQVALMSKYLGRDDSAEQTAILDALSNLTTIPVEQLTLLPFRVQQVFMQWIVNLFLRPSSSNVIDAS